MWCEHSCPRGLAGEHCQVLCGSGGCSLGLQANPTTATGASVCQHPNARLRQECFSFTKPHPRWSYDSFSRPSFRFEASSKVRRSAGPDQKGTKESAEVSQNKPFELWEGTNGFGEEFERLYLKTTVEECLQLGVNDEAEIIKERYLRIARSLQEAAQPIKFIAVDALANEGKDVPTPELLVTSVVVERALGDFETLARSAGGAVSGVDRIHTTLHAYLIEVCKNANLSHVDHAGVTALFRLIQQQYPKLQVYPPGAEAERILRGLAQIVDALQSGEEPWEHGAPKRSSDGRAGGNACSQRREEPFALLEHEVA